MGPRVMEPPYRNCGMRISDCGLNSELAASARGAAHSVLRNPQSAIRNSSKLEHLQSVVAGVDRDDPAVAVHRDAPRVGELAGLAAGGAPRFDALPGLAVHELHAVVPELAHHQ